MLTVFERLGTKIWTQSIIDFDQMLVQYYTTGSHLISKFPYMFALITKQIKCKAITLIPATIVCIQSPLQDPDVCCHQNMSHTAVYEEDYTHLLTDPKPSDTLLSANEITTS